MTEVKGQPEPSADDSKSLPADYTTSLLGVVTIVAGVATGLFSDLKSPGQVLGLFAFVAWVIALGVILWGGDRFRKHGRWISGVGFVLTAGLLVFAFVTGPRLNARTLILTPDGLRLISAACPNAVHGSEVSARVALNQLGDQFVHIEVVEPGCDQADRDIRVRSQDLRGVLPAK